MWSFTIVCCQRYSVTNRARCESAATVSGRVLCCAIHDLFEYLFCFYLCNMSVLRLASCLYVSCALVTASVIETEVAADGATLRTTGTACAVLSFQFEELTDQQQLALAQQVNETVTQQKLLVVGGFGGSGTRGWASLFHTLSGPDFFFSRGNFDWDSGYVNSPFEHVFPPCDESIDEYFDVDKVRAHLELHDPMKFLENHVLPPMSKKYNFSVGEPSRIVICAGLPRCG